MKGSKKEILVWLGENLKKARKENGFSQEGLAEKAGVDLSYYGKVERGETSVSVKKLHQITTTLNIPLKQLFLAEPGRQESETASLEEIIQQLRQLEDKDLKAIKEIISKMVKWKAKS